MTPQDINTAVNATMALTETLAALKRELANYNIKIGKWRERA